jgi:catechol 2,3-dioxygenase-like lactoylglutathione lyase family enzyme
MLGDKTLKAFIPTVHPEKAKVFYRDILGLTLISEDQYALEFDANGTPFRIITVPELKPQPFTVLGWNVADVSTALNSLNKNGISGERYPFLEQDDQGIWTAPGGTKVAWFRDPDGNLLSLDDSRYVQ